MNYYVGDEKRTLKLTKELDYFKIRIKPIKFRYSMANYTMSKEDNSIYKGIASIKYMNEKVSNELYSIKDMQFDTFVDLLYYIKQNIDIDSRQIQILIKLDFFSEFGDINKLIKIYNAFSNCLSSNKKEYKKQFKKDGLSSIYADEETVRKFANRETDKMFTQVDVVSLLKHIEGNLKYHPISLKERISYQTEHLGYIDIANEKYRKMFAVLEVDTRYSPKLKLHSLRAGTLTDCKIKTKTFNKCKLKKGDVFRMIEHTFEPKKRKLENGDFENIPNTKEMWIERYVKVENV